MRLESSQARIWQKAAQCQLTGCCQPVKRGCHAALAFTGLAGIMVAAGNACIGSSQEIEVATITVHQKVNIIGQMHNVKNEVELGK
jgi:hypothetical protein